MRSYIFLPLISIYIWFGTPLVASAHGEGFTTFLATSTEGFIIDVDWESPTIEEHVSGTFAFRLYEDTTWEKEIPYKDLWVRIIQDNGSAQGKTLFAGPIAQPEFGHPRFLYVFHERGSYTLSVRYNREGDGGLVPPIAAEFPFVVEESWDEDTSSSVLLFLGGAGVGVVSIVAIYFFSRGIRRHYSLSTSNKR